MKFALYQPWIYLCGGIERSMFELISRSRHQWIVYTGHYEPHNTFEGFRSIDVRVVGSTTVDRSLAGVLKSVAGIASVKLPADDEVAGIVVWCDGVGDMLTFRNAHRPLFNICSTPLRPAFDPVYSEMALGQRGMMGRMAFKVFRSAFKAIDRLAWRHYRGVFATSTEVRNRIVAGGLHDGGPSMVMAYPGIEWVSNPEVSYEPFILLPGRIMWTKNIQQGIRAFLEADLPAPWRLIVAGFVDRKSAPYLQELRDLAGLNPRIEFVVSPDDDELKRLYDQAAFCLFPPLNEDWGIVPLEAMAHAKAVIANARGGPAESLLHGHTGFLLEPDDDAGWVEAIRALAGDREKMIRMGQAGHERVRRFSWDEFVRIVDENLENWVLHGCTSNSHQGGHVDDCALQRGK